MKKYCVIAGIVLLSAASAHLSAQSFNITYDFAGVTTTSGTTDPSTVPTAAGVTFGSFSAAGYVGNPNASGRFSFTTNGLGGVNAVDTFSSFTGSLDPAKYLTVTLTPISGFTLNIDTIAFTVQRSGTGIRNYAVRGSGDSFAANLSASISPANTQLAVDGSNNFQWALDATTTAQNGSLITLGTAYDALTSATTFRFYGWNAEGVTGTFSIDNVNIIGSVTATPEPASLVLATLGGIAVLVAVRRKR